MKANTPAPQRAAHLPHGAQAPSAQDIHIEAGTDARSAAATTTAAKQARWKRVTACVVSAALASTLALSPVYASAETTSQTQSATSQAAGTGTPPSLPGGAGAGGGADTQSFDYTGSYSGTKTADGQQVSSSDESIEATGTDTNALLAENGGTLDVDNATITKSGDDTQDQDGCNFYGVNSGALAVGSGSALHIGDSGITTSSAGSNGIFATDSATVFANNDTITTTSTDGNARGLDATYGGTIIGNGLTINTTGPHSATVATDRGGGNISLTNSTLDTAGSGSPLFYSTGDIEAENVTGTATGSQIAGIEGANSVYLSNSYVSSTNDAISGSDPIKNGVIIYQSTSGDADTSSGSAARFAAVGSTLATTISSGSFFYLTNTTANVVLQNTTLSYDSSNTQLLTAQGNDSNNWGSAGSNGATVNFTLRGETVSGGITADDISTATVYLLDATTWTGAASVTQNSASSKTTSTSPLTVNVGSDSTWVVNGNSTVTNLNVENGGKVVDESGNTVTIKDSSGSELVKGSSEYSVIVTGSYGTSFTTGSETQVQGASIDRTSFDSTYGTSTAMGTNADNTASSSSGSSSATSSASSTDNSNPVLAFFDSIRKFFLGN